MTGKWATRSGLVVVLIAAAHLGEESVTQPSKRPRDPSTRWDAYYARIDLDSDRWQPNALLVDAVRVLEPGRALDLGAGQGRNTLHLSEAGWRVTAIDISSVGLELIRRQARERGLEVDARLADMRRFEFGSERWDLIVCSYIHMMCVTEADEIVASLAPEGLLIVEGFVRNEEMAARGRPRLGFDPDVLPGAFSSLEVLHYEQLRARADWSGRDDVPIVRFVARKPRT